MSKMQFVGKTLELEKAYDKTCLFEVDKIIGKCVCLVEENLLKIIMKPNIYFKNNI